MQLNYDLFANSTQPASRAALAAVEALASQQANGVSIAIVFPIGSALPDA